MKPINKKQIIGTISIVSLVTAGGVFAAGNEVGAVNNEQQPRAFPFGHHINQDRAASPDRMFIMGKVVKLDAGSMQVIMQRPGADTETAKTWTVTWSSDTQWRQGKETRTRTDVHVGDRVLVRGAADAAAQTVRASGIQLLPVLPEGAKSVRWGRQGHPSIGPENGERQESLQGRGVGPRHRMPHPSMGQRPQTPPGQSTQQSS